MIENIIGRLTLILRNYTFRLNKVKRELFYNFFNCQQIVSFIFCKLFRMFKYFAAFFLLFLFSTTNSVSLVSISVYVCYIFTYEVWNLYRKVEKILNFWNRANTVKEWYCIQICFSRRATTWANCAMNLATVMIKNNS